MKIISQIFIQCYDLVQIKKTSHAIYLKNIINFNGFSIEPDITDLYKINRSHTINYN